jgi:hypothetical protein
LNGEGQPIKPRIVSMKIALSSLLFAVVASAAFYFYAAPPTNAQGVAPVGAGSQIYLLRGLFEVFSLGMDKLSTKLKEKGYEPRLIGWEQWPLAETEILAGHRNGDTGPIVLFGHSLGGGFHHPARQQHRSSEYNGRPYCHV